MPGLWQGRAAEQALRALRPLQGRRLLLAGMPEGALVDPQEGLWRRRAGVSYPVCKTHCTPSLFFLASDGKALGISMRAALWPYS